MKVSCSIMFLSLLAASCTFGPDHEVPSIPLESSWKSAGFSAPVPEGSWWALFGDATLNGYIREAQHNAPVVRAALARYDQARADLGLAQADRYPSVTGDAFARRQQDSALSNFSAGTYDDYRAALNLSWELDLWGRVRRKVG